MLLLEANHAVSADRLIDALWGDHPPDTAKNTLQVYVSQLRKLLPEGALETVSPGYRLAVAPEALDLSRFEELAQQGRAALGIGDAATAAQALGAALALWRGTALADLAWEPFAQTEAARREELRLTVLEDRIEADLARRRHGHGNRGHRQDAAGPRARPPAGARVQGRLPDGRARDDPRPDPRPEGDPPGARPSGCGPGSRGGAAAGARRRRAVPPRRQLRAGAGRCADDRAPGRGGAGRDVRGHEPGAAA